MDKIHFLDADGTFSLENPENYSGLYFPIAGTAGLKCSVTPNLGGDSKVDQETFLLEPVTIESLHNNRSTRNFWCRIAGKGCWSVTGVSAEQESRKFTPEQDASTLTAGFMWQTVKRVSETYRLEASVTSFVPAGEAVEIMYVRVRNRAETAQVIDPVAAVPIYGRSADNIRDHRNVTSMLHRVRTVKQGVLVKPTMSFDEKGHRENHRIYYVLGAAGDGGLPAAFYPTVDAFIGEGGSFLRPRAVYDAAAGTPSGRTVNGREAMGGIAFPQVTLQPGQSAAYIILLGVSETEADIERVFSAYDSEEKVRAALEETRTYWQNEVNVRCHTASSDFDNLLRWISFQPLLRRIYGCSFLPHHDYGRGGRGWRDLWQDCLSLLLMDPGSVGGMIKANFGGVRIDGTNATIIGAGDGSFIADRNGIARVWMDHALWPLMTTKLYIDQTGDLAILNVPAGYFKDPQAMRGTGIDALWDTEYGNRQRTEDGSYYAGSILEHLLIQHLTAFFEVGDHNIFRLRGADWNDALDMAADKGESVAFTCAYAGNLRQLAELLRRLEQKGGQKTAELLEELQTLLIDDPNVYEDVRLKKSILEQYVQRCRHSVTGRKVSVPLAELAGSLESMAGWLMEHIRRQEWIHGGQSSAEALFPRLMDAADGRLNARFGEGYWSDHWTYNLDLVEEYLAVYPEQERQLLYEPEYTYFLSQVNIAPRARRYAETEKGIRQYHALDEDSRRTTKEPYLHDAQGRLVRSSLIEKLTLLCAVKFAALDPYGMGIEMEGGKPGWYDALNGLPGLLGSSMCETYELARMLEFTISALERNPGSVELLEEIAELLESLSRINLGHREELRSPGEVPRFWNAVNDAKEDYRARTYAGVSGRRAAYDAGRLARLLSGLAETVRRGIEKALAFGTSSDQADTPLCPSYFAYDVTGCSKDEEGIHPQSFALVRIPAFLEGPVRWMKLNAPADEKRALYERVRASELYDKKLSMYRVNASLQDASYELGRARAFTPGWLENGSIWLHMEYKYLLELLRCGLYREFFQDFRAAAVPFLDPEQYGRSTLENSSFLASSVNPDRSIHGRGFVARLSGSTAEFLSIWRRMLFGEKPFAVENGELICRLQPALPSYLIGEDQTVRAKFLGRTQVAYRLADRADYIPGGYRIESVLVTRSDGEAAAVDGGVLRGPLAQDLRRGSIPSLEITLRRL